jgi:3-phenylpropionate/trans-cinnamate dioxygenase ferredoxin reductase subunit
MTTQGVVIVGAGHAGTQLALSLRQLKYSRPILLLSDERERPYQRPPLSKAFMLRKVELCGLQLRSEASYEQQAILWRGDARIDQIDRVGRRVRSCDGKWLEYGTLVLATGTRNRRLDVPGANLSGVAYLRTFTEALALRERLTRAQSLIVVGGGFIGLEMAAVARSMGLSVVVIEGAPRLMSRALSPITSKYFHQLHICAGVDVRCDTTIEALEGANGEVRAAVLSSGERLSCDLVLIGIGVLPNCNLACESGLADEKGVSVDGRLATCDPHVFAIGDCAWFPSPYLAPHLGSHTRLESVQNAVDHGKHLAAVITGGADEYRKVPWFWSDQYDAKLQIAGLTAGADQWSLVGDSASHSFGVHCFAQGRWLGFESVNWASEHLLARAALEGERRPTFAETQTPGFELRCWLSRSGSTPTHQPQ